MCARQIRRGALLFERLRHLLVRMDSKRAPLVTQLATELDTEGTEASLRGWSSPIVNFEGRDKGLDKACE
jgi:hypothetical protein